MKVTVEVDCTPAEARLFFGLPNVEPMQDAVMAQLEKRMLTEMDRFSPEGILKSWLSLFPQNAERLQEMSPNSGPQGPSAVVLIGPPRAELPQGLVTCTV